MLIQLYIHLIYMIDLDDLRLFDTLARAPSLAAAARDLGVTPPALTVRLKKIEHTLGAQLAIRGPRQLALTDAGERLVAEAIVLLRQLDGLAGRVTRAAQPLEGPLRIAAPFGFGRRHVAPLLQDFCTRYPGVVATLTLAEHPMRDASHSEVVFHVGPLRDSSWIAHRIGNNQRWICASPSYLDRHGEPRRPDDLVDHRCLCLRENDEDISLWHLRSVRTSASTRVVRVRPAMSTNDGEVLCAWAEHGLGLVLRSQWDLAPRIAAGQLVRVLPAWRGEPADIYALVPSRTGQSARAQAFVDHARRRSRIGDAA
jgi:DNA-binding transcriptional LysR family regulator